MRSISFLLITSMAIVVSAQNNFTMTEEDRKITCQNFETAGLILPSYCGTPTTNVTNCERKNLGNPNYCVKCKNGRKKMFVKDTDYCIETQKNGKLLTFQWGPDRMCAYLKSHKFSSERQNILAAKKCIDINNNDFGIIFNIENGKISSGEGVGLMNAWDNKQKDRSASIQFNKGDSGYNRECTLQGSKIVCSFPPVDIGVSFDGELLVAYAPDSGIDSFILADIQ